MIYPIIPQTSLKVLNIFGISEKEIDFESIENHKFLKSKNKINSIEILFKKIENND